jgi:translation initiation factor 2 subunit 2
LKAFANKISSKEDPNRKREEQKLLAESDSSCSWQGSERDYTYEELLTRIFNIMREKNPDMITGEKRKFVMKPPQVARVGTKKTSFSNFAEICKL